MFPVLSPFQGQLKSVMEHVLEFAVRELTKIVEDSFDDLLLEFTKKEWENHTLKKQLQDKNVVEDNEALTVETEDLDNDSASPSSSKVKNQESKSLRDQSPKKEWEKEQTETTNGTHCLLFCLISNRPYTNYRVKV